MTSATKNSFWYLGFNLARLATLFIGNIWISRSLGPETFGHFSYFLSLIVYLSALDSLCHESIIKQYISGRDGTGLILGTASLLSFTISLVSILAILVFGLVAVPEQALLMAFLLFIPSQLSKPLNPIANYFDIRLLSKYSSLALFIGAFVSIVFRAVSVGFTENLIYQSFGYSLQGLVYGVVLYVFYRSQVGSLNWQVSWRLLVDILKKSFPIFLSTIIYLSLSQCDIFMIRHILDVREVGIYSIVVKLSEPWVIVSSALCTSYFPLVFNQKENSRKQERYFIRANQISLYFVSVLGIVLCLFIDRIVAILLGPEYAEVGQVFKIYFWSILFLFFANIQHIWEVYNGKYSMALNKTIIACILKISLNLVLGQRWGLNGFAVASLISLGFYGIGFNFFSQVTRPYLRMQLQAFYWSKTKVIFRFAVCKGRKWLQKRS
jgi:O-antigen/teichoic acid export membrane protein